MFTSNRKLSVDEVRKIASSVFAEHAWEGVSDRYTFIPTITVMESMLSAGWNVVRAQQNRTLLPDKREFTRHMLRFRQDGDIQVGGVFPEIVLINSHDRGAAYQLHAGLFKLLCSNGMVVDDGTFHRVSVRHSGRVVEEVLSGAQTVIESLPHILNEIDDMRTIELTPDERRVFASAALDLKYKEGERPESLNPLALVSSRRIEDSRPDLWTTMNVIQENLLRGGIRYYTPSHRDEEGRYVPQRRQRTREVKAITEDIRLNKALWTLAEELKRLKRESQ